MLLTVSCSFLASSYAPSLPPSPPPSLPPSLSFSLVYWRSLLRAQTRALAAASLAPAPAEHAVRPAGPRPRPGRAAGPVTARLGHPRPAGSACRKREETSAGPPPPPGRRGLGLTRGAVFTAPPAWRSATRPLRRCRQRWVGAAAAPAAGETRQNPAAARNRRRAQSRVSASPSLQGGGGLRTATAFRPATVLTWIKLERSKPRGLVCRRHGGALRVWRIQRPAACIGRPAPDRAGPGPRPPSANLPWCRAAGPGAAGPRQQLRRRPADSDGKGIDRGREGPTRRPARASGLSP